MSDISQSAPSSLADFLLPESSPLSPSQSPALSLSLPANQASLQRHLSSADMAPFLNAYPSIAPEYAALQANRVNVRGTSPWNKEQGKRAIVAAAQHAPVTAPPEGNIFQNLTSDVGTLAHSIGNIPAGLINEFTQIPNIFPSIAKANAHATNPLEVLGGMASAPGLRLIPGSFIASQFREGGEGVHGLTQHPLFTALDVLPYASKAASMTKTVGMAETVLRDQAEIARATTGLDMVPQRVRPIQTFLRNYHPGVGPVVDDAGKTLGRLAEDGKIVSDPITAPALVPNAYGQAMEGAKTAFMKSRPGVKFAEMFGQNARDITRGHSRFQSDMSSLTSETARSDIQRAYVEANDAAAAVAAKYPDMSATDRAQVARVASLDNPEALTFLSPAQQEVAAATRLAQDRLAEAMTEAGELTKVYMRNGPEFYNNKVGNALIRDRALMDANVDNIVAHYTQTGEGLPPIDGTPLSDAAAQARLTSYANNPAIQSKLSELADARAAMDWHRTRDILGDIQKLDKFDPLPVARVRAQLRTLIKREGEAIPARVMPRMQEELSQHIQAGIQSGEFPVAPENVASALEEASHHLYSSFLSPDELRLAQKQVGATWQHLLDNGFDPQFVHAVTPRRALSSNIPILDFTPTLSSTKERLWDASGQTNDLTVSLSHQAQEGLRQTLSKEFTDQVIANKGISGAELQAQFAPMLTDYLKDHPLTNSKGALADLIDNAGYKAWDPKSFLNPGQDSTLSFIRPADQIFLPKEVVAVLDQLKNPPHGALASTTAPLMKIFRTSVLTLRPQWYLGNALGGAIFGAAQAENPAKFLMFLRDGYNLAKNPLEAMPVKIRGAFEDVSLSDPALRHMAPVDAAQQGAVEYMRNVPATKANAVSELWKFKSGQKLASLRDQMMESSLKKGTASFFDKLGEVGSNFNSLMDNMYNAAAYLEGYDSALSKGMTKAESVQAGIEASRRVFETWDTLTPGERGIVKSIFPFYGFTRSMIKYVAQYPATHPTRLALMASLAKAEQEDIDSGLPSQLRNLMFLGDSNSDGTVKTLSIGALNPFQDIGSYASMLGFMAGQQGDLSAITRNINPLLSTAISQLGVDPSRGQGELYPSLYYDPTTGRLAAQTGNPVIDFATNLVPQTELLADLFGQNAQFKSTLRTNPDAAGRMLLSTVGVPVFTRDINLPQERMKSEVMRYNQQSTDFAAALKSGDLDAAKKWPGLRVAIEALKNMTPEERAQYQLDAPADIKDALAAGAY